MRSPRGRLRDRPRPTPGSAHLWIAAFFMAVGWLLLVPEPVFAWGPGTHLALGDMVLASLYLLPPAVRTIVERFPIQFLYGSIAADISFAKKYVPEGRHCHDWGVGEEILGTATSDPLRSVGYGYLAHLAADTVAHNLFVPRRLLLTSTTQAMGHTYWEHRMDVHVGEQNLQRARRLVTQHDHDEADAHFDRVLSATIFTFRTNRRIFRGMIRFQGDERWMQVFEKVLEKSRFDLPEDVVHRYVALSFDYVMDYLINSHHSSPFRLDPVGALNLRLAKKVRRMAIADGGVADPVVLDRMADDFFPMPDGPLAFFPEYRSSVAEPVTPPPPHSPELRASRLDPEGP